jgi:hypothetical protein
MFHSYIGRKNTQKHSIGYPQINAPSSCCYLSNRKRKGRIVAEKRHVAMQKCETRENNGYKDARLRGKNGQVSELSKQWVL